MQSRGSSQNIGILHDGECAQIPIHSESVLQQQRVKVKMMNQVDPQQQQKFLSNLSDFLLSKKEKLPSNPIVNPFILYKTICRRGGYQSVTNRKQWGNIKAEVGGRGGEAEANAADQGEKKLESLECEDDDIRAFYVQYLAAYERKNYFGIEEDEQQDLIIESNPRKQPKTPSNQPPQAPKPPQQPSSLESQIAKTLQSSQKQQSQTLHLNKSKLTPNKIENKRIILGLQGSNIEPQAVVYSLNMLMLYSVNVHFPFLFENNEKIFTALCNYTQSLYPPNNPTQLEHLRTVVAILRNFTMNPINLKYILGTPLFGILIQMFNTRVDPQCSKNIIDIMSGLVKVGWDTTQILQQIQQALLEDRVEEIEGMLELIRGLMDQRDQGMVHGVKDGVGVFIKVLMSGEVGVEIKEQVLEILSFVSDVNADARLSFSKNPTLLSILLSILQHMRTHQKLSQFAALTLSNISTTPGARYELSFFQSQLMVIGFSDDSLAGIIANILADVANG